MNLLRTLCRRLMARLITQERNQNPARSWMRCSGAGGFWSHASRSRLIFISNDCSPLIRNCGLDQFGQQHQRLLPSQITGLDRNGCRDPFLCDIRFSPAYNLP